ncbi:DMT family transporter [Prauserella rugosa]|uniref:DMT family transporter n=1 Tax=Prauserella rugosa TaxID=43354 RepID=UPI001FE2E9DA|nr:DMT family transporter [Prauserella rugosa]
MLDRLDARLVAVAGALTIASTALFVALADASSATVTFFRCALALPLLVVWVAGRRLRWRFDVWHALAGAFLGLDMVLWSEAIAGVGAGIATVLVNVQVVIVPLVTLVVFREPVCGLFWATVPVLLAGVALAGGVVDTGSAAFGEAPVYGTIMGLLAGVAYAGYLVVLRRAGKPGGQVSMLVTVNGAGALVALAAGLLSGTLDLAPSLPTLGWVAVLAVTGQIVGWLLIGAAIPRLPSALGATLLLVQPVGAVLLGVLVLGERPSVLQFVGCGVVVASMALVARVKQSVVASS